MPAYDLLIRNGKVVTEEEGYGDFDIYISDGKIAAVKRSRSPSLQAARTIDAEGKLLLPGLIDSHVHFREPGMTHKEDFESGSRGAAAGGVTTVFDMPTTKPVVTNVQLFREKASEISGKSVVDFGLYGGAGPTNLEELEPLAKAGAIAFKTYQVAPPPERIGEYEGAFVNDSGELLLVMEKVSGTRLVHCLHAEDNRTVVQLTRELISQGRRDPMAHFDSRPNFAEAIAVFEAVAFAEAIGATIHILHLSTKEAVEIVSAARRRGVKVTAETCPHYLLFTKDALERFGPLAKYNPPPREKVDVAALWDGLKSHQIDIVVSDHAPHTNAEKAAGLRNIWAAPPGTPGVELVLPLLMTEGRRRGLSVSHIAMMTSTAVARIFGVQGRKGRIAKGLEADIVIINPRKEWVVKSEELQTKARDNTLYDGAKMTGKVVTTLLRGEVIYEEGVGFSEGRGKLVPGKKASPARQP